ncbi:MAG TPA: hypothetical protein VL356_08575, partial [Acidocella sp.]|nr:hypothetical protein [Acidocella sp.]
CRFNAHAGAFIADRGRNQREAASFCEQGCWKESGRFLKKAAQKLLRCWAMGWVSDNAHGPA